MARRRAKRKEIGDTREVENSELSKSRVELGTAEALFFFPANREKFGSVCTHDRRFTPQTGVCDWLLCRFLCLPLAPVSVPCVICSALPLPHFPSTTELFIALA